MLVGVRRVVVLLVGSVWLVAMTAGAASADVTVHVTTTADEILVNGSLFAPRGDALCGRPSRARLWF